MLTLKKSQKDSLKVRLEDGRCDLGAKSIIPPNSLSSSRGVSTSEALALYSHEVKETRGRILGELRLRPWSSSSRGRSSEETLGA